jgi:predicted transposase YdaD
MFIAPPALHLDFRLREVSTYLALTDDLQIHLLQLNHLQVTAENVYDATPAERWAYFLQNVDKLTPAEIRRLFPDQEFSEAAGVLEMISKTPEQLLAYNARLKFQRDEAARMEQAALDGEARGEARGREIGVEIGVEIGRISLLQELLGQRIWSAEEFAACDATQLNAMADQLQQQLRARNS